MGLDKVSFVLTKPFLDDKLPIETLGLRHLFGKGS